MEQKHFTSQMTDPFAYKRFQWRGCLGHHIGRYETDLESFSMLLLQCQYQQQQQLQLLILSTYHVPGFVLNIFYRSHLISSHDSLVTTEPGFEHRPRRLQNQDSLIGHPLTTSPIEQQIGLFLCATRARICSLPVCSELQCIYTLLPRPVKSYMFTKRQNSSIYYQNRVF